MIEWKRFLHARLCVYDKMGKIVLDDIRDKFKRPEEAGGAKVACTKIASTLY